MPFPHHKHLQIEVTAFRTGKLLFNRMFPPWLSQLTQNDVTRCNIYEAAHVQFPIWKTLLFDLQQSGVRNYLTVHLFRISLVPHSWWLTCNLTKIGIRLMAIMFLRRSFWKTLVHKVSFCVKTGFTRGIFWWVCLVIFVHSGGELRKTLQVRHHRQRCLQDRSGWPAGLWRFLRPNQRRRGLDCLPEKTRRLRRLLPKLDRLQTRLRWPERRVLARVGQDPPTDKSDQQQTASWAGGLTREHGLRRVRHVCCGRRSRQLQADRGGLQR